MINSELFIHQVASAFSPEMLEDVFVAKAKAAEAKKLRDGDALRRRGDKKRRKRHQRPHHQRK